MGELTFFVNTILGFIQQAQSELIDELGIKVDQLAKGRIICERLEKEHGLSANAVSVLYGVIQEELFDSSKSMSLDDAAHLIGLSKQSARKCVEELLVEGCEQFAADAGEFRADQRDHEQSDQRWHCDRRADEQ